MLNFAFGVIVGASLSGEVVLSKSAFAVQITWLPAAGIVGSGLLPWRDLDDIELK